MATGKIKFFKEDKGYGFITESGSNKEIFVHVSGITEKVQKYDEVEFDVQSGKKGDVAVNVKKLVTA